ncbi:Imm1 family immunity protein [Planctellipticum variicoloris]|uniref:Imm1 family immunity protein n=1 Tax=Planctellipticum variicoloris TaxID=3064265 RepID=UPI00301408D8|nr:Imm1 family immunity protein [Planctomycetaceae bacterium SH412]
MTTWTVTDGSRDVLVATSWRDVEACLTNILNAGDKSPVLTLAPNDQPHFAQFGLSNSACFLEFHEDVGACDTFIAQDETSESNGIAVFDYVGELSEVDCSMCISRDTLLAALHEYVETCSRPKAVSWIEIP